MTESYLVLMEWKVYIVRISLTSQAVTRLNAIPTKFKWSFHRNKKKSPLSIWNTKDSKEFSHFKHVCVHIFFLKKKKRVILYFTFRGTYCIFFYFYLNGMCFLCYMWVLMFRRIIPRFLLCYKIILGQHHDRAFSEEGGIYSHWLCCPVITNRRT